ncbi:MAG: hypothetical protein PHU46_00985 [Rhodocyclaceae bacterium]|nr:hypothetical protein [Rhodocyclaceae bacterium]
MYEIKQLHLVPALILGLTLGAGSARADSASHQHAPQAGAAAKSAPFKKFATDEALRKNMEGISALANSLSKEAPSAAYKDAAGKVEAQIAAMVKACKLDPKADKALHEIIADMEHALVLMRGAKPEVQKTGLLALKQALRNYGTYFDHPGWPAA